MASQKEPQRVISGALDFMSPADKAAASAARWLQNWRVDQVNQLRSRRGSKLALSMGSGNFHTIALHPNGDTVFGVGTGIFVGQGVAVDIQAPGAPDGNKLGVASYLGSTYVMNKGVQLRLNGTNGYPWGVQPPSSAPTVAAVTPSTSILNNFDGSSGVDNVSTMTPGGSLIPCMTDDTPVTDSINNATAEIDNTIFQNPPASLNVSVVTPSTILIDGGPAGNTTTAGVAADADQFSFWLACSDATQIQSMTVTLFNPPQNGASQGLTVQCFFQAGSAWDPAKILNQAPNTWTQVFIRRTLNVDAAQAAIAAAQANVLASGLLTGNLIAQANSVVTDLTGQLTQLLQNPAFLVIAQQNPQILGTAGTPVVAANAVNFDWTNVSDVQISIVTVGAVQVNLNQFQVSSPSALAAALSGSGQYYVSFVDEAGHDGLPCLQASAPITLQNQGAQLSAIPVSPAVNTVARNIWRIGFGCSSALLAGVIDDNTTTTWTDPTTVDQIEGGAVYMPTNRTPPPPCAFCIGPFFGKIVAFNAAANSNTGQVAHPSRAYWTPAGTPWCFYGNDSETIGDWEDVGGDDDQIVAATNHKTILVMYKLRSIWRFPGDPAVTDPVQTNSNVGVVGPSAVCNAGVVDYFVAAEGVYAFNLDQETKISGAIDGIFKGDYVQLDANTTIPPINKNDMSVICIEIANERLRVSYPSGSNTTPDTVLIYNTSTGAWQQELYPYGFSALAYWGNGLPMTAGSPGGTWYGLEAGETDNGTAIALGWQSIAFDEGLPDFYKWYSDLELEAWLAPGAGGGSVTLNIYLVFDNGATVLSVGTATLSQQTKQVFAWRLPENPNFPSPAGGSDFGWRAKNFAVRVTGNTMAEIIIGGIYMHMYPEERTAHTFDSGPTNFGMPEKVKQVDYLEFYATGTGQSLQRTLASDLPGRILTIRDQANMLAPNGRGDTRFRLGAIVEGRNFRLTVNDSASGLPFQLHQARARMRPVGEYLDGTNGEYFESPEFSVSPGRVGELKDFLLDYDCSGPGGFIELFSDLPGSALSVRRTLAVPYQTTRAPYVFPFEQFTDQTDDFLPVGQLFKVRIYPPAGGIMRLHGRAQFRGRIIGCYFNGANGEVFQTQPIELFGGLGLAREVLAIMESAGPMNLSIAREIPGLNLPAFPPLNVMLNPSATSAGRVPISARLLGATKGILWRFTLSGPYLCRLYDLKIMGRRLQPNASGWDWAPIPLEATPDEWANIAMPCGQTPEAFTWIDVSVDPVLPPPTRVDNVG